MKKTYQNPTIDVVTISVARMIASSSGLLGNGENPAAINLRNAGETDATSGNLSRYNDWDDEEEENY